jgi:hypothetical protein
VVITHHGRLATVLRGEQARRFLDAVRSADSAGDMAARATYVWLIDRPSRVVARGEATLGLHRRSMLW